MQPQSFQVCGSFLSCPSAWSFACSPHVCVARLATLSCADVCALYPAVDRSPTWGEFSHLAPSDTGIGSVTTPTLTRRTHVYWRLMTERINEGVQ